MTPPARPRTAPSQYVATVVRVVDRILEGILILVVDRILESILLESRHILENRRRRAPVAHPQKGGMMRRQEEL